MSKSILSILIRSLGEAFRIDNFLPFFMLYLMITSSVFIIFYPLIVQTLELLLNPPKLPSTTFPQTMLERIALGLFALLIGALLDVWVKAAFIIKIKKGYSFAKSLEKAKPLFLRLILLYLVIFLLSYVINLSLSLFLFFIPFIESVASIIIALLFFFAEVALVVDDTSITEALKRSVNIIASDFLRALALFIGITLIVTIINGLGFLAGITSSIGFVIKSFPSVLNQSMINETSVESIRQLIKGSLQLLKSPAPVLSLLIMVSLSTAITTSFSLIAKTAYYVQARKSKRPEQ